MEFELTVEQLAIRDAITTICRDYPEKYWQECDANGRYPDEFVEALGRAGWLGILVPEEYGGAGGTVCDAAVMLETINRSGGSGATAHAQLYTMGTILRHGSEEQKRALLPGIASNELRLQAFAITEPEAGSDTTRISTFARRDGDSYVIRGAKMWTSRVQHSDYLLLLARTTPYDEVAKPTDGLSVFLIDLREAGSAVDVSRIDTMISHETNEVVFDDLQVPVTNRIGEEGKGFWYILSGMNVERILVASESLGDGYWLVERASSHAGDRQVFGRPIGANQGVQFPIAQAFAQLEAASLMRWKAAVEFDSGGEPGFEANAAKLLASQAAWAAANAAMDTFGGLGLAKEYGIERKFRESRLPMVAPVNNNLLLAFIGHKVLGMPKSY